MDEWELLRHGRSREALKAMQKHYAEDEKDPSTAIELGAIYLWLRDWRSAYSHFCHFNKVYPWTTDVAFKFSGVAKWCAGERQAAVAEWKQGIDVDYADMGGGITIPLHLYFAAALAPDLMPMAEAVDLLQTRLQAKARDRWPGYLGKLVLGEMSREDAIKQSKDGVSHLWGEQRRQSEEFAKQEIAFWGGVKLLTTGDAAGFFAAMKSYVSLSWDDFEANRDLLIDKLRAPEFYLARCEAEGRASANG